MQSSMVNSYIQCAWGTGGERGLHQHVSAFYYDFGGWSPGGVCAHRLITYYVTYYYYYYVTVT